VFADVLKIDRTNDAWRPLEPIDISDNRDLSNAERGGNTSNGNKMLQSGKTDLATVSRKLNDDNKCKPRSQGKANCGLLAMYNV
jgi:hypothetical protein